MQPVAQLAQQRGVLTPAFHQDRARALQRGLGVGHAFPGVDETGGERLGNPCRIGQQAIRQGLQAGLAGDLRAGAALLLVGQVEVFQARLAVGGVDLAAQFVGELALVRDAGEDRGAAVLHLAQVGQPRFEVAQLGVVEAAGDLLAVARDERHGRAFVEQADGGLHLRQLGADLVGDGLGDLARKRGGRRGHGMRGLRLRNRAAIVAAASGLRKLDSARGISCRQAASRRGRRTDTNSPSPMPSTAIAAM